MVENDPQVCWLREVDRDRLAQDPADTLAVIIIGEIIVNSCLSSGRAAGRKMALSK